MDIDGKAILNGLKLILITFVYGEKYPSVSEANGALNNDCSVSCFVETFVFCLVLMIQVLEALPSSGAFFSEQLERLGSSAQGWVHGCEIQVQKYPRHSGMCRQNVK